MFNVKRCRNERASLRSCVMSSLSRHPFVYCSGCLRSAIAPVNMTVRLCYHYKLLKLVINNEVVKSKKLMNKPTTSLRGTKQSTKQKNDVMATNMDYLRCSCSSCCGCFVPRNDDPVLINIQL